MIEFSFKVILLTALGILLFSWYVYILWNGENSLTVLNNLKKSEKKLLEQRKMLKKDNQYLQKEYFQLKQLEAKE